MEMNKFLCTIVSYSVNIEQILTLLKHIYTNISFFLMCCFIVICFNLCSIEISRKKMAFFVHLFSFSVYLNLTVRITLT